MTRAWKNNRESVLLQAIEDLHSILPDRNDPDNTVMLALVVEKLTELLASEVSCYLNFHSYTAKLEGRI